MRPRHALCLFFLLASGGQTFAHSFSRYVSTPVSPPRGFEWLLPASLVAFAVLNIVAFRALLRMRRWFEGVLAPSVAVWIAAYVFYRIGRIAATRDTGPPPGLGPPSEPFWGWGWQEVGALFLKWNAYGLLFLLVGLILFGRLWRRPYIRKAPLVLALNIGAYLVLLIPYVASGALVHGRGGGYVRMDCESQIANLSLACIRYAEQHDGKLPEAKSMYSLLPQIEAYLEPREPWERHPIHVCRYGAARYREPTPYVWNAGLSGEPPPSPILMRDGDTWVISCPYHRWINLDIAGYRRERAVRRKRTPGASH